MLPASLLLFNCRTEVRVDLSELLNTFTHRVFKAHKGPAGYKRRLLTETS